MRNTNEEISVIEPYQIVPQFADCIVMIDRRRGITPIAFAETMVPVMGGSKERIVSARLIIPTEKLEAVGRAILGAAAAQADLESFKGAEPTTTH